MHRRAELRVLLGVTGAEPELAHQREVVGGEVRVGASKVILEIALLRRANGVFVSPLNIG